MKSLAPDSTHLPTLFASEDAELRRQAVARAKDGSDGESCDLLFSGLGDADWRVRKEATAALRERETEPWLVTRLVDALLPGENIGLRNAVVEALGAHGEATISALERVLPRLDVDGLKLAAEALALTRSATAMPLLRKLRKNDDANVRAAAIEAVAQVGRAAPEAASRLLDEALDEPDPFLRLVALDVIRRLDLAPSWERLEKLLGDPLLAQTGLELATRLGEPAAAPYFIREILRAFETPDAARHVQVLSERQGRALSNLAHFVGSSPEALSAVRTELAAIPEETCTRLVELTLHNREPALTKCALVVLAAMHDVRVADFALDSLDDELLSVAAHRAVELFGDSIADTLRRRLLEADAATRARAIPFAAAVVERTGAPGLLEALRDSFDSSSTLSRAWLDAMVRLGDREGLERALSLFEQSTPASVRRRAAGAAKAFASLFPERARARSRAIHSSDPAAECVCWFMSVMPQPLISEDKDLAFLVAAASSPSAGTRLSALAALRRHHAPAALDAVVFAMSDEAREVQLEAVAVLGDLRDDNGVAIGTPYLIDFASRDRELPLTLETLRALGRTRDARAIAFLLDRVTTATPLVSVAAVEALSGSDEAQCRDALTALLGNTEPEVIKAALQWFSTARSIPEPDVVACLHHPVWDVRRLAADVLGSQSTETARHALSEHLSIESESIVREAVIRSLGRHGPTGSLRSVLPPAEREPE